MNINFEQIPWDTKIIGKNVFELLDSFDEDMGSFKDSEKNLINSNSPFMVFSKIDSHNLTKIHFLEAAGFNYIETQFHLIKKIKETYKINRKIDYSLVREDELPQILDIAKNAFNTDRYSIDPFIGSEVSGKRYVNWIISSISNENFRLYKYTINENIIGFHLIKLENKAAYALLVGLKPEYKGTGLGLYINMLLNNLLYDLGIKVIDTYISAINTGIFNIHMFMQYQIKDVKTILRKIYE